MSQYQIILMMVLQVRNNYDHQFRGPVTVQYALQQSYNPPAVRVYQQLGPQNAYKFLNTKIRVYPIGWRRS